MHFIVSCLYELRAVRLMESSAAFEVSLTQDVDLFNFIHISCVESVLWLGVRLNPETRVQHQYEQL